MCCHLYPPAVCLLGFVPKQIADIDELSIPSVREASIMESHIFINSPFFEYCPTLIQEYIFFLLSNLPSAHSCLPICLFFSNVRGLFEFS